MHRYMIRAGDFYGSESEKFKCLIEKHKPTHLLYRDKSNINYAKSAAVFMKVCLNFSGLKSYIHQDKFLAKELQATGVHLTSTQFGEIAEAKNMGLEVIISTHTHEEVLRAQDLRADAVTYSPIFASPNKGEPKGVEDLKNLLFKCNIPVFALGGIVTQEQVDAIAQTKAYGFASIRYFS